MILVKTEMGLQVLKNRSVRLTPRQRTAFILFDGRRTVAQVLAAGMGVLQEDVDQLIEQGLLGRLVEPAPPAPPEFPAQPEPRLEAVAEDADPPAAMPDPEEQVHEDPLLQERYLLAQSIAARITAELGVRGLRLHQAVEAATNHRQLDALTHRIRAIAGPGKSRALEQALLGD